MWRLLTHSKQLTAIIFAFLSISIGADGGFIAGTLVKTPSGYTKIECLQLQDSIVCYDLKNNKQKKSTVINIHKKTVANPVAIELLDQIIITTPYQKFYFASTGQWLDSFEIRGCEYSFGNVTTIAKVCDVHGAIDFYEISVAEYHNFYITTQDVLVHNAIPVIFGVAASIPTIMSTVATLGLGAISLLSFSFLQRKKSRDDYFKNPNHKLNGTGSPSQKDPEDPEDMSFFDRIKKKADSKARTKRFGNLYRDPETKLWWSKDRAGHGGSAYKVFKEGSKGLEWVFDADAWGNPIVGKHKGPTGIMLSYKDLIVCH